MDMSGMTATSSTAGGMAMTATASAASTTTSASMSMSGGSSCKISMLWNWYTIDSCFIARSWHITSNGMFAGSCIGVILLTMSLELLRRATKEYDGFLLRKHATSSASMTATPSNASAEGDKAGVATATVVGASARQGGGYRPSVLEQAVRALLHTVQFAVAYFVMLLAMYYNGYIIICIFIGAYLGAFIFQWEVLGRGKGSTSAANEATVCCG